MPIYEYNCQDCKQIFEEWQKDYEERDIPCPVCGANAHRIISSSSFVLKGGGWYASGYSAGGGDSGPASEPAGASAKKAETSATCPAPAETSPQATTAPAAPATPAPAASTAANS